MSGLICVGALRGRRLDSPETHYLDLGSAVELRPCGIATSMSCP